MSTHSNSNRRVSSGVFSLRQVVEEGRARHGSHVVESEQRVLILVSIGWNATEQIGSCREWAAQVPLVCITELKLVNMVANG